jgi:tetratricopeptide (TPR) repeat protein
MRLPCSREPSATPGSWVCTASGRLFYLRGNLHFTLGNIEACLRARESALEHARKAGSAECEARALGGHADGHYVHGRMALANRYFAESVKLARAEGLGRIEVANHVMVGWSLMHLDPSRAEEIRAIASESLALAERVNDPRARLLAVSLPAWAASEYQADLTGAVEMCQRSAAIVEAIGARRFEAQIAIGLGRIAHRRGALDEARHRFRYAVEVARATGPGFLGPMAFGALSRVETDADVARRALVEGETLIVEGCVGHNQPSFYRDAIYVSPSHGDCDEAERYARALADFAGDAHRPLVEGILARARALTRFGRGERGVALDAELRALRDACVRGGLWDPSFAMMLGKASVGSAS